MSAVSHTSYFVPVNAYSSRFDHSHDVKEPTHDVKEPILSSYDQELAKDPVLAEVAKQSIADASDLRVRPSEKMIASIVCWMQTLIDGKKHKDYEEVMSILAKDKQDIEKEEAQYLDRIAQDPYSSKRSVSLAYPLAINSRELLSDTYFDQKVDDTSISMHDIRKIFSKLAKLFLGQDAFNRIRSIVENRLPSLAEFFWKESIGVDDLQTLAQQKKEFKKHFSSFKNALIDRDLKKRMMAVFTSAQKLLDQKEKDGQEAFLGRMIFYATFTFSVIGWSLGQRVISFLGGGAALVTLFMMNQHDSNSSEVLAQSAMALQRVTHEAYFNPSKQPKKVPEA